MYKNGQNKVIENTKKQKVIRKYQTIQDLWKVLKGNCSLTIGDGLTSDNFRHVSNWIARSEKAVITTGFWSCRIMSNKVYC